MGCRHLYCNQLPVLCLGSKLSPAGAAFILSGSDILVILCLHIQSQASQLTAYTPAEKSWSPEVHTSSQQGQAAVCTTRCHPRQACIYHMLRLMVRICNYDMNDAGSVAASVQR